MKKIFSLFLALTAVLAVSVAAPRVTMDFTSQDGWNIPTSGTNKESAQFTDGNNVITLAATTNYKLNSGYLILGKSGSTLTFSAFDFPVAKIAITGTSGASAAVKQNIYVGDVAVSTETTGAQNVTNEYVIDAAYQAAGNIYVLKVTSAHNTQISKIEVYEVGSDTTEINPQPGDTIPVDPIDTVPEIPGGDTIPVNPIDTTPVVPGNCLVMATMDFTGTAWGLPTTSTKDAQQFTDGNYTITLEAASSGYKQNSGYLMLGKSGATLTFPAFDFEVSKIVITGREGASAAVIQNIYVGNDAVSIATTGATGENTYEIAANYRAAGTIYVLKVTSSHNTQITKIEVYTGCEGEGPVVIPCVFDTITVPQALERITNNQLCEVDVKGVVSSINTSYIGESGGTINIGLKDPASNDTILGYKIYKDYNKTVFANVAEVPVSVGQEVKVHAFALVNYKNTPEISEGYFSWIGEGVPVPPVDTIPGDTIPVPPVDTIPSDTIPVTPIDTTPVVPGNCLVMATMDFTGTAWGLPTTSTKDAQQFTDGNYTITLEAASSGYKQNSGYLMLGKSGATLTFPAFDFEVSKIVITGREGASAAVIQNIYVGNDAVSIATTGATGENTYEIAANYRAAGTIYVLKVTSSHNTQITKIEVYTGCEGEGPVVIPCVFDTITVPQALERITNNQLCEVDVKGVVSSINTSYIGESGGTINIGLKDPASNDTILGYKIYKDYNKTVFANVAEVPVSVGQEVKVHAFALVNYKNTPEISEGYFSWIGEGVPVPPVDTIPGDTIPVPPVDTIPTDTIPVIPGDSDNCQLMATMDFTGTAWGLPTAYAKDAQQFTDGSYTITLEAASSGYKQNSGYLIMGKSGATLTFPAFDFEVSKIVVTGREGASGSVIQNIYVDGNAVSIATTGATGENTYEIPAAYRAAGTIYVLKVTSSHNTQITKIEVYSGCEGEGPVILPCEFDTITVPQALERIRNNQLCEVDIKGVISSINTAYIGESGGTINIGLKDTVSNDTILGYKIYKDYNKTPFANVSEIPVSVGQEVKVHAFALVNYKNTTPEISEGYFSWIGEGGVPVDTTGGGGGGDTIPVIPTDTGDCQIMATMDFTGTAWGLPTTNTKDAQQFTDGNYTITLEAASNGYKQNSGYLILGKSGATLTFPAFDFPVSKIVITGRADASGSVVQNIYVGETAVSTQTTGAKGENTYEIAERYQAAGNIYVLKVTSAHNTQITKIEIYSGCEGGGDQPICEFDTISVSQAIARIDSNLTCPSVVRGQVMRVESFKNGNFVIWMRDVDNMTDSIKGYKIYAGPNDVQYKDSASINFGIGDTIYVYANALIKYNDQAAGKTYPEINIGYFVRKEGEGEQPVIDPCPLDTISVVAALNLIAAGDGCPHIVMGRVNAIDTKYLGNGNINVTLEDYDDASQTILCYRMIQAKGVNFSGEVPFSVGDSILVYGKVLKDYNGTKELSDEVYLVEVIGGGTPTPGPEPCVLDTVSVSAALDLITAQDACPHVVMGIVKSMETQYLDKGNMNVTITDVDDASKTIYCYRMTQGKGVNFSADSIPFSVGDTILVYGKTLKMYQNTPELADEVYLVEVIGGGTPFVPEPCVLDTVSVSEALALLEAADVCPHIVRGVVSSGIKIESYGAIKYLWIQDVDNPEDSICCYNMYKDSAKAVFENMNDIPFLLGDTIYVYGKSLKVYNGTKELSDLVYYVGRDGGAIQRIEIPIATIYVHSDEQFHYITAVALTGDTLFEDESWERLTYDQSVEGVYDLEYLEVNVPMMGTIELAEGSTLSVAATSMTGNNITYAVSLFAKDQYGNIYVADFEFISPDYPDDNPNITTSLAYEIARALPSGTVSTKAYNVYGYWVSNYIRKSDSKVMGFYMSDFAGVTGGTYFEAYGKGGPTEGQYVVVKNINLKMYNSTAENDGSSFTYEILDPAAAPTLRDVEAPEISVAEAVATAAGLDARAYSPIYYTVHGFVTAVEENEFLMADDTTMVGEFKAYKCVVADGSQIGVGDEVAVRGIIQNYVDKTDATRNAYEISHGQVTVINHAQPDIPSALPAALIEKSNKQAIKLVQDGQIIILKNGIRYNALGTRLDK